MQVPISSSVAGVIGLSNSRESRLNATGATAAASANNQATKPLEKNASVGDRDAQEQYLSHEGNERPKQEDSPEELDRASLLELPAEEVEKHELDLLG